MTSSRRRFIKWALGVGAVGSAGGGYWLSTSRRRVPRYVRQILADARRTILPAPVIPTPEKWSDNEITVCWLGHATVLINFFGAHIITDPALGKRVGISVGLGTAGPKRYIAPALKTDELPRIDVVLLSHAHMDHMDVPTLTRLSTWAPRVITARATADVLRDTKLTRVSEVGWGERVTARVPKGELEVMAFEVKHWGTRWPSEMERGYNGYILRREGKAIMFGGDTAYTPLFSAIRKHGPFGAAIMPIAAYNPYIRNHCTPEEAVQLANAAGAHHFVPIHHQTFRLSEEPMTEPLERLEAALERERGRLALRQVGESFVVKA